MRCIFVPVKRACKHEIVVRRQLLQPGLEFALVDQAAGLVDDDERVDNPNIRIQLGTTLHLSHSVILQSMRALTLRQRQADYFIPCCSSCGGFGCDPQCPVSYYLERRPVQQGQDSTRTFVNRLYARCCACCLIPGLARLLFALASRC